MNTSSSNAYNDQLHLLSQNNYSAHDAIDGNNTTSDNNIVLHNISLPKLSKNFIF